MSVTTAAEENGSLPCSRKGKGTNGSPSNHTLARRKRQSCRLNVEHDQFNSLLVSANTVLDLWPDLVELATLQGAASF
jgi:hypothetical protein